MGEEVMNMRETPLSSKPPHFVLVHGISGGSWCWYKIRCLMENSGYKVSCIDLKSAGIDPADANSILSFDDYNKPLLDFMSSLPENEQVYFDILQLTLGTWYIHVYDNSLLIIMIALHIFAGDTSRAQCRRAKCNSGNSQVWKEDPASSIFGCHHVEVGFLDRSRRPRSKIF